VVGFQSVKPLAKSPLEIAPWTIGEAHRTTAKKINTPIRANITATSFRNGSSGLITEENGKLSPHEYRFARREIENSIFSAKRNFTMRKTSTAHKSNLR
jgi:hypothetical protein